MHKLKVSRLLIAAIALFALPTLSAAPVTFAQFFQAGPTNAWVWTNPSGPANSTFAATMNVTFEYQSVPGLPVALQGPQNARVTLTLDGPVLVNAASMLSQIFQLGINGRLQFRLLTPYLGQDNLLTATFTDAGITGRSSARNASFSGLNTDGATLSFESDFIFFNPISANDFSVGLSSLTPALALSGGQIRSFSAAGAGTFSVDPGPSGPIPEPVSTALLGIGLLALGGFEFLRRRWPGSI
jgi:MYXO-CTERM domain-containing protein